MLLISFNEQTEERVIGPNGSTDGTVQIKRTPIDSDRESSHAAWKGIIRSASAYEHEILKNKQTSESSVRFSDGGNITDIYESFNFYFAGGATAAWAFFKEARPLIEIWLKNRNSRGISVETEIDGQKYTFFAADAKEVEEKIRELKEISKRKAE